MNKKVLKIAAIFCVFLSISCSFSNEAPEDQDTNSEEFCLDYSFLPDDSVIEEENIKKQEVMPDAFEEPWILSAIEEDMDYFNFKGKSLDEIDSAYESAINDDIMVKIAARTEEYEKIREEKYPDMSCSLSLNGILKGDVVLTVSRNSSLMAIDNENTFHHALLCTKTPDNSDDLVFITSASKDDNDPLVQYFSLNELNSVEDIMLVLRLYKNTNNVIDKAIEYAREQLDKEFNTNYIDKMSACAYYCSQLVWRSYYEAGLNIDYNDHVYNDYNLVLASDIYKSPYLYIIKYSE